MDIVTIRSKPAHELAAFLAEQRTLLADLRFQQHAGERTDVHTLRETRRTIARLLTVLHEQRYARGPALARERLTPRAAT